MPDGPAGGPPADALAGGGPEVLSCDGDTELEEGQECVDGVVVFSEEIVVTSTPIPVPPPGTSIPPPTTRATPIPRAPSWPLALWPQKLRDAVADAVTKSETCSVQTNSGAKNANAKLTAARDAGRIVPGGPLCDDDTVAHADSIPGSTIHICPVFFDQSASDRSLTIMHEGLHLAGVRHQDFGVNTEPHDDDPMDAAIKSACGYP